MPPSPASRHRKIAAGLLTLLICLLALKAVNAHAELERSEPEANELLHATPPEIRLWFTEPLESAFSRINLYDSRGQRVPLPDSQVAPDDLHQLFVTLPELADDTYTVDWSALSAADGHPTRGSYSFSIGVGGSTTLLLRQAETIPPEQAIIRTFNLLALALAIGSIGYLLWVWQPAQANFANLVHRPYSLIVFTSIGWLLIGITSILILLMQASIYSGVPLSSALPDSALGLTLTSTRFGGLWVARMILWLLIGVTLWLSAKRPLLLWGGLGLGAGILFTQSLFSHASAAEDAAAAVAADWLHLTGAVLWFGGLATFAVALASLRTRDDRTQTAGIMTGYFSNLGRACMIVLALTGFYAGLLQVGSLDALTTTPYGRALLIKLILFLPLLIVAGINLLKTYKELRNSNKAWFGRLRGLIGVEIALAIGIFAAVGVMTSIAPAKTSVQAQTPATAAQTGPFFEMQLVDGLMAHLEFAPGYVGNNTFTVMLFDEDGNPITDASLIRLRFTSPNPSIGRSELRPELTADGVYTAEGSNLSLPGEWQIRMTVQRPNQFDTLYDFTAAVSAPEPEIRSTDTGNALLAIAGLAGGLFILALGGYWCVRNSADIRNSQTAIGLACCIAGIIMVLSSANSLVQSV